MIKYTIILTSALLLYFNSSSIACHLVYEVRSDAVVSELCVTIEKNERGVIYRSIYRDVKQLYQYSSDNSLERWEYADLQADTDFKAIRDAGEIIIHGTSQGKAVNKSLSVGNQVWLQNSEFGLLGFLRTEKKTKEFIVVAPEDLAIKKFRATRAAEEEIAWNDKKIGVVKLTARLRGFFSLFWQATYWHRLPEMTFLRYEADGLPGVPKVDIRLVREISLNPVDKGLPRLVAGH